MLFKLNSVTKIFPTWTDFSTILSIGKFPTTRLALNQSVSSDSERFKTRLKTSKTGPFGLFHYWYQVCVNIKSSNITSGTHRLQNFTTFHKNFSFGVAPLFGHLDNNEIFIEEICQKTKKYSNSRRAYYCFHYHLDFQFLSTWWLYQR